MIDLINFSIVSRFVMVFVMSLLFGVQRQRSHKPIGFGTFVFVSVGACALSYTALMMGIEDSIGLVAAIVTSIGFLGAGALIKTSDKIFGFTTAASIWIFAILGLEIGLGNYFLGWVIYLVIWVIVMIDSYLEEKSIGSYQKKITVVTRKIVDDRVMRKVLHTRKQKLISMEVDKDGEKVVFVYLIESSGSELKKALDEISHYDWFKSYKIE